MILVASAALVCMVRVTFDIREREPVVGDHGHPSVVQYWSGMHTSNCNAIVIRTLAVPKSLAEIMPRNRVAMLR